ncbi:COG1470 family protein [Palaeococcus ferrophilus]|uniref:COG1470 family protein n=1 Tax=Palaeococcus ferrophilus TaxID=83868 RepID=UPI0006975B69|nr:carboxypeptidase-like regulatory domain-containing protein [Palaeococcus ferrophilus]
MNKWIIPFIIAMLILPASFSTGEAVIVLQPLQTSFTGEPGESVDVAFNITNMGNETAGNVLVLIENLPEGATYTQAVFKDVGPNETREGHVQIILNKVRAGVYNVNLVARVTGQPGLFKVPLTLRVKTVVDYSPVIEVEDRYLYGSDVTVSCEVRSNSNGVINGLIEIELYRGKELLKRIAESTYIAPYDKKEYRIVLPKPDTGSYLVVMHTKFGSEEKTVSKSFEVYRRNLAYEAYFENGVITVRVYNEEGKGVEGIPVNVNGMALKTDSNGLVMIEAKEPGSYRITMDFDGKTVETVVEVKKLFLDYSLSNEMLEVYVRDSSGKGIANVSVSAEGVKGRLYGVTDEDGSVAFKVSQLGYGPVRIKAQSSHFLGDEKTLNIPRPTTPTPTPTPTVTETVTSTPTPTETLNVTNTTIPTLPVEEGRNYGTLALILLLSALTLTGSSYMAFFRPVIMEEQLDRYYFIKVRAPKLKSMKEVNIIREVNAVDARATKGKVTIDGSRIVWEIEELEPEEEASLQILL